MPDTPDMPESPRAHGPGDDFISGVFDDFPLDADLRELYLRLRLDGAVWRSQQPADDGDLAAYAVALAEEAPAFVDVPSLTLDEPRAAPATRRLRERSWRKRGLVYLGDVGLFIAVAAIVALVSVTLLQLSPLALRSKPSGAGNGPTPLPTVAATPAPTPTATRIATATRAPRPTPTTMPIVAFMPYLAKQSNGKTISESMERGSTPVTCSPDTLNFEVLVKFTHSNPGTFNYEWRFYDGSTVLSLPLPSNAGVYLDQYAPIGGFYTASKSETLQPSSVTPFDTYLKLTQPPQYSSTPRWGAQFVITQVNGGVLATPIASAIIELPAPAC